MGFKNFRLNVIVRVLLLSITILLLVLVACHKSYIITPLLLASLVAYQIISIIKFVEKTNRSVVEFLQSVRYSDFSRNFKTSNSLGQSFDSLKKSFNDVIDDFQKIRTEKEEHYFYIQNIIQHVGVGILAYRKNGEVEMLNNAAKKLFQIYSLQNINELSIVSDELVKILLEIKVGDNKLVKVQDEEDLLQLAIFATEFKLNDRVITLVSIKNIQAELEAKEMESWQKLIRVLTHEIMNSIAPISSLASTLKLIVDQSIDNKVDHLLCEEETIQDLRSGLQAIHKRSTGLIHFVDTYRNLTRIPIPNFTIFPVSILFENIQKLLTEELKDLQIIFESHIEPSSLELTADEQLIEQVLINLVKNSIHATEGKTKRCIKLKSFMNKRDRVCIQVIDNGQGILKEVIDKVFIPFFTTKPTGSGIGLSLSKQIMRLHSGSITVQSEPDINTVFTLTF